MDVAELRAPEPPESKEAEDTEQNVDTQESGCLNKKSVFKFPKNKRAYTILLVGETGSGKTAFLSLFLNLLQGHGPLDLVEQHCVESESGLHKTKSQTSRVTLYSFTTANGINFKIIDTPGLGDTRGDDENNKNKERIRRSLIEYTTRIDVIMLVVNGRVERLTASMECTLESLATLFPQSIKDNFGILFTNVETDGTGLNFHMTCLQPHLQEAPYWCFDNPLSLSKSVPGNICKLKGTNALPAKTKRRLIEHYDDAVESLDDWLKWLDKREAIPTTAIVELYHKSTETESRLVDVTLSLEYLCILRNELQEIVRMLEARAKSQQPPSGICERELLIIKDSAKESDRSLVCESQDVVREHETLAKSQQTPPRTREAGPFTVKDPVGTPDHSTVCKSQDVARGPEAGVKNQQAPSEMGVVPSRTEWVPQETSDHNTVCLSCYRTCHTPCNIVLDDPGYLGGWCRVFKTFWIPNRLIPFKSASTVKCSECNHEASEHRNYRRVYKQEQHEVPQGLKTADQTEKARVETQIKYTDREIEQTIGDITQLVKQMINISLNLNFSPFIRSAIRVLELRKERLASLPNSNEAVQVITEGIVEFEKHLDLIKHTKTDLVGSIANQISSGGQNAWVMTCSILY